MTNTNRHTGQQLTVQNRKTIWREWCEARRHHHTHVTHQRLAEQWHVSRPTISKVLSLARVGVFAPLPSTNAQYRCIAYGMRHLAKVEARLEERRKRAAKRYNKRYPGEMVHYDTKRLPLLVGEDARSPKEYLFVGIDDFSRELYAAILPDKTQHSAAMFLAQVLAECPYTIEVAYSDNGKEYRGTDTHAFVELCAAHDIRQKFTKVRRPRTNGKAERVIRTLMEQWHEQTVFKSRAHRQNELRRFVNWYNTVKPHAGIDDCTPEEKLLAYFYPQSL